MRRNHRKHGRVTENETAVRELFDISKLNNQSAVTTALLSKPLLSPASANYFGLYKLCSTTCVTWEESC